MRHAIVVAGLGDMQLLHSTYSGSDLKIGCSQCFVPLLQRQHLLMALICEDMTLLLQFL